ncbi:MAG: type II secretion system protein M [Enterobacterales bacterium]|nr:type II secretion system protein M [Enterobacterales bacterium]
MDSIKEWYNALDEGEQKIVFSAAIVIGMLMLYLIVVDPVVAKVNELQNQVMSKQKNVDWMKQQLPIIMASKNPTSSNPTSALSLSAIVNRTTGNYKLPVSRRDSKSPYEMQIWFDNVNFDSFLSWASELESRYGVTIANVNVRSRDRNGITSINVKLLK